MRPGLAVGQFHVFPEDAMSNSTLFDRLNHELEAFGKKAQAALDEGKLQIELMRARKRRDNAVRDPPASPRVARVANRR
jgi:hypothetical protein